MQRRLASLRLAAQAMGYATPSACLLRLNKQEAKKACSSAGLRLACLAEGYKSMAVKQSKAGKQARRAKQGIFRRLFRRIFSI
jgi:hypothetical protein